MKKIVFMVLLITIVLIISGCANLNSEDPQYAMKKTCVNTIITCTNGHTTFQVPCANLGGHCGAVCPYVEGERWWPIPGSRCPEIGTPSQQVEQ